MAVSLSADALGLPESLWSSKERKAGSQAGYWATEVLREPATHCGATYGPIGVEENLPPQAPSLRRVDRNVGVHLVHAVRRRHDQVQTAFERPRSIHWPTGQSYSGWQPCPRRTGRPCSPGSRHSPAVARCRSRATAGTSVPRCPGNGRCQPDARVNAASRSGRRWWSRSSAPSEPPCRCGWFERVVTAPRCGCACSPCPWTRFR